MSPISIAITGTSGLRVCSDALCALRGNKLVTLTLSLDWNQVKFTWHEECPPLEIQCARSAGTWLKCMTRTCRYFVLHNANWKPDNTGITSLTWIQIETKYWCFLRKWAWEHRAEWTCKKWLWFHQHSQWQTSNVKTHCQNVIWHIQHDLNMLTPVCLHVLQFKLVARKLFIEWNINPKVQWTWKLSSGAAKQGEKKDLRVISHQKYDMLRNDMLKAIKI